MHGGRRFCCSALGLACVFMLNSHVLAQSPSVQRGFVFVNTHCSQCHAIDRISPSPLSIAPPLRDLHKRYQVDSLQEAFAEGTTGHPSMPEFRLDPGQISDVIAFLKSLE